MPAFGAKRIYPFTAPLWLPPGVIEAVARDFDLHESGSPDRVMQAVVPANPEKLDVVEALRTLATLADRLRRPETELSKEGKI